MLRPMSEHADDLVIHRKLPIRIQTLSLMHLAIQRVASSEGYDTVLNFLCELLVCYCVPIHPCTI